MIVAIRACLIVAKGRRGGDLTQKRRRRRRRRDRSGIYGQQRKEGRKKGHSAEEEGMMGLPRGRR